MAQDPIIPDSDGQTLQVKQLNAAQVDAQQGPDYAGQAGLTGPKAPAPAPEQQDSWGALIKDHPVLSQHLTDPDFARAAKDDIPQLSKIERLFGGWDEMLWKSKLDLEADTRNQTLAAIGRAQKAGTATPEMLKQADDLEKEASSVQEPNVGFVPGIVPAVVGVVPGLLRATPTAFKYGVAGLFGGALLTKNKETALAAGGAMAGAGLTVGMAMDTANTEMGLAYRQYIKAGADPKTAEIASDLVALANGGLQAIPVEKVFNMVPGISNLLAGKKTRDLVGSLITSNTGRAAMQRFALRAGESGLLMALVGGGQELVRELGALGAGADKELHGGKIWDAATGGFQQGLGFGIGHGLLPFVQEKREAQIGLARGEMYKAIAGESTNSKLRESMPGPFKNYVNAVIAEHGNVEEAKAPAEKLTSLLQKEGITEEQLQERMPEVAKQLREAGPNDEIVIPMGDLATHLAPLKSFEEFSQDLRVGDDSLTPREAKKIGELADKFEKEQPAPKDGEEPEPGRKVFDDVYEQLTKAGQDPNVARHDASLWAAFATSRGERLGVDPFEYYKSRAVSVGAEFPETPGVTLGQKRFNDTSEIQQYAKALGYEALLTDFKDHINLDKIVVPKELRKSGLGTDFMRKLTEYADAVGKRVTLTPSDEYGATSKNRLKDFYKQFGFVENKGKHKDFSTREAMYRDPNTRRNTLEQRGGAAGTDGYRGKISFDDARSYFNITLTGKANLSTFLHESGHAFFEFMRKDAEGGHAQSQEDFGKLLEWMGVKPGEQPSTEQLEQFARGFEGYLMEGKAPAPEMRGLFRTFASWLKSVYKGMKSLGVNLTDDVRGVMDRMLATDKEIEKAKAGLGLEPMKKPEGMSDAEYKAYTEKFGKAMEAGRNELEERALREFRATIGEERAKTQADVEAATRTDPAHNAYESLRTGKRLDGGEVPEEIAGKKLDREAVAEAGHKGIKWASITEEGGLDPDVAAPLLGFENGPALLDALEARRSRTKEIKEETERRMMDKYPNSDIAKMSEQAVTALHLKDDVGNVLWLEAKALGKQIGQEDPRTARAVVKEIARRRVSEMTALEMQPGRFARGEERAAGEWADAMKAKDFAEAHRAKLDQILNHEMFKAVSEAKDEVDSIRNYLDGFNELPNRRRIGKAGQSYMNAIDAIISDIELKRQTNKTLARRASLESYLSEMENEDGALITIPAELRSEAALKNYKQMTLDDLRTVHDAVANIEAMARLKNKLFDGRERRNYQETAVRLSETVKINLGSDYAEKPGAPQNPSWWAQKKEMLRKGVAEMKKIEFLARAMDGGETAGWVHSVLFQPFATAEEKALNLTKKITEQLFKPLREMSLKERAQFDKTVDFLGTPMKMRDVIAVALNMGNAGNKRKMIDGYGYRGWTEEKVTARLGELLTGKHLDLIEHFWKTIGSLWPEIKALSERTTGVAPPKVEPTKLTINGRELEGGYYPIVYDRDRSYKAEQFAQKKGDLFENNFLKPGVSKGFTEARTQFAAPILLSLNVIPSHMNEVIHYLTHLEPIRAVDRLMAHSAVRKSVTEAMGKETYNLFRPWLQAIAHDGVVQNNTTMIDNVLRHLRVGASVTRLGFKLSNSIMQGFNILSSVKELGGFVGGSKYLALGMKAWMSDFEQFTDPFKYVHENSPEIRGKTEKYEHNLIGNFDHFTSAFSEFGHYKQQLGHFAMSFMTLAWKSVEAMTWYAAREKAFAENHSRPLEYADSVVRLSQMGEGMKDKAAIMRGGEGTKIFTYMYSWYSTIFNQLTETQPQARGNIYKAGELASRYWWMVLAPTVMMSLARGKHPKNDDGETGTEAGYLGGEIALETAKAYLGPIGGITADTMLSGHDAKFAPWISTVLRGLVVRGKMAAGHPLTDKEKKDLFESTGIVSHLPAGGMYNALKYVSAVQDGKLEEPVRDLLFRSPGDWK